MSNSSEEMLEQFDKYLESDDVAALVIRESLIPVEGKDGVVFPATYAAGTGFKGGYNITHNNKTIRITTNKQGDKSTTEEYPEKQNVCLIDSVGSQANRMEPLFKNPPYDALVPQIIVQAGNKKINLLEAGHRAGDAIVRCSALQEPLQKAFQEVLAFNHEPLARIAPTSLVFGAWDSRDTQAKVPRLISSTIRAFDVRELKRSAQYFPATKYVAEELIPDPKKDKKKKEAYAERGFVEVPATGTHGGVIADGGIRRDAVLSLAALRLLKAGKNQNAEEKKKTLSLRRYIFGLALTAFTARIENYLRQGCMLVNDPENPLEIKEVHRNGQRTPINFGHEDALAFAQAAAKEFGVGLTELLKEDWKETTESDSSPSWKVPFDKEKAEADLKKKESAKN